MTEHLSSSALAQLSEFVTKHMGFDFPPERWLDLERGMRSVSRACEFDDMESCVQWLVSSPVTQSRIEILASHLTVGETYFFRERPSFDILEARVLPELIDRRRNIGRRLRLWSAGCCTGEEAYSIAILLKRLLPDLADWQITVLATDINPLFLKKAEDGVYGEWSFRGMSAELKERYFAKRHNGRLEILPEIKRMVTFSYLNLMEDTYPSLLSNSNAMDIIFCRNVLMYFGSERAKEVVRKLRLSLLDGGWLIVSPCEASHVLFEQFTAVNFPGTLLYQKDNPIAESLAFSFEAQTQPHLEPMPSFSLSVTPGPVIPRVEAQEESIACDVTKETAPEETEYGKSLLLYEQGCYEEAARILSTLLAQDASDGKAVSLLARVYANQGNLAEARRCCEQAIAADKLNPACHILQATILQEQGAFSEAAQALQRALYLEPNLVLAHFALGNLARRQQKVREADRHFDNARTLLNAYSREQVLPEFDSMTAGRLMTIIYSSRNAQESAIDNERNTRHPGSPADRLSRRHVKGREKMTEKQESIHPKESAARNSVEIHYPLGGGERVAPETWAPSAEESKNILKARARRLARDDAKEKTIGETVEIVEFLLAYETYGIESSYVREICPLKELTPVPCTPPFVLGIINIRGQIISVIDMKKFFDLPERGLTDLNKVIIVHDEKMEFGILADSILGVRKIYREEIHPPLPTLTGVGAEYLTGVTKDPLVVLDMARILSSRNIVVHEEIEI